MKKAEIICTLSADPVMARLISEHDFPESRPADPYFSLLRSIVSQQLSVKAAATIFGRVCALFPDEYPDADYLLAIEPEKLRGAGLSHQKVAYMQNIATFHLETGITDEILAPLTDEEVLEMLTQIKGVGKWTVQMLLMFSLARPDVFAPDDLGIRQSMFTLYKLEETGRQLTAKMHELSEKWRPFRTYACRYLWENKDRKPLPKKVKS